MAHHITVPCGAAMTPCRQRIALGRAAIRRRYFRNAVIVDVHRPQLTIGQHQRGAARGLHHGGIDHAAAAEEIALPHQHICHCHVLLCNAGDIYGTMSLSGIAVDDIASTQLHHGAAKGAALGHRQNVGLPHVDLHRGGTAAITAKDEQLGKPVLVDVLDGIAAIGAAHQRQRLASDVVDCQGLHIRAHFPAHDQLQLLVAVEILIADTVDVAAAAFYAAAQLIAAIDRLVDEDLHGLFITAAAEKGHRFHMAIAVEIHHVDGLQVLSRGGSSVFIALGPQLT